MDLVEQRKHSGLRHPWERARLLAIERLLAPIELRSKRILDLGCGDGFVIRSLASTLQPASAIGIDVNLTPAECEVMSGDNVEFHAELPENSPQFDLLLLLDVLEHVQRPVAFLAAQCARVTHGGWVLLTVPAFAALFSEHDRELKHFRRYRRSTLVTQAEQAGLRVAYAGYFFASLLPARALTVVKERLFGVRERDGAVGLGAWRGGPLLTAALTHVLSADVRASLALSRSGVTVPGLSAWALCQVPAL